MNITRKEILDLSENLNIKEIQNKHIGILSWIFGMKLDLNPVNVDAESGLYMITPNETVIIDTVCQALYEFTDMNAEHLREIKENVSGIMTWRCKVAQGSILEALFITNSYANDQDVVVNLCKFVDQSVVNSFGDLMSTDMPVIKTLTNFVSLFCERSKTGIVEDQQGV